MDGSGSLNEQNFNQEKQLIRALAARLGAGSQLGVIQFGSNAQIVVSLTTNMADLEAKVACMKIGDGRRRGGSRGR